MDIMESQEHLPARIIRMVVAFDGTAYHGWQRQPNGLTVQQVVEERLFQLFGEIPIRIQGSSRTDSGVHSLGLTVSFPVPPNRNIPEWKILKALNRLLPEDIRIRSVETAPDGFNARFSAKAKSYVYVINSGEINPFTGRWSWHLHDFRELEAVSRALAFLKGTHDFSTFSVESKKYDDPVRSILRAELYECGPLKCIHFIGDGFLYKMVRSMVGVLAEIGRGRIAPEIIPEMLDARSRCAARDTAPARGLFLMKVFYENREWEDYVIHTIPWMELFPAASLPDFAERRVTDLP